MEFTENVKGYVFATEQEAQSAVEQINSATGFPVSPDSVTQNYCSYETINNTIFIRWDETIESVLGLPTEFSITIEI